MRRFAVVALACSILTSSDAQATDSSPIAGRVAPEFSLADPAGKTYALGHFEHAPLVVVAFLGCECPLVTNLYAARLEKLARQYQDSGLRVVAINSNIQDSIDDMRSFIDKQEITFPFLKDPEGRVADAFGATRTPEVFLLDHKRVVRYQGRIDDQGQVGFIRKSAHRHDLSIAIDELLAGKEVSQPTLAAVGCLIGKPKQTPSTTSITYASHVAQIFQKRCVECHRTGEIGPFAMEQYDEVIGWADMIAEVVDQQRMPPWFASPAHGDFSNESRLTADERKTILDWVAAGAPLGDPEALPPTRTFSTGWNIGKPDLVVPMAKKPLAVRAEGAIGYQHYVVDPGFLEDKWMTACEVRPGNRSVVHHVLVFCKAPGHRNLLDIFNGGLIAAYAPGMPAFQAPAGVARRLPAGSKILIQMHYTTNGRATEDLSSVGFRFCDSSTVSSEIEALAANNFFIAIPPHKADHPIKAVYHFQKDKLLVNLTPHMHMRGKSFRFEAVYPSGEREILLDVPRFDFNWQLQYNLAKPKMMPKGTQLVCTALYDNSAGNPANPDPNQFVRFGEQTWDEMMIGWFTAMSPRQEEASVSSR